MLIAALLATLPVIALQDPPAVDPPPQEAEGAVEAPPTPEEAAAAIKEALEGKDFIAIAATVERLGVIEGKEVVKAVAPALKSKDPLVRTAALRALRYNPEPSALAELLKRKADKTILEDPDLAVEYYYALGQSGDPKAIDVLKDDLFSGARGDKVARARIAGLGRIRDLGSVDALMGYMVSGHGFRGGPRYLPDVRLALVVLTGQDFGLDTNAWNAWWGDNKKTLKISDDEWPLPNAKMQRQWQLLWATPAEKEKARQEREEDREKGEKDGEGGSEDGGGSGGGGAR